MNINVDFVKRPAYDGCDVSYSAPTNRTSSEETRCDRNSDTVH